MTEHIPDDVSPAGRDLRAYTDELRPAHRVVRNDLGEWVLLHHDLVLRAALDDRSFSSAVSRFLQVPNGLIGTEHSAFREALDPFLSPGALAPFLADFERIAADLVAALPRRASVEAVREIGGVFAVRAQSAWLSWPADLERRLLDWMDDNHAATRSGELARTRAVAEEFDAIIASVLASRRPDSAAPDPDADPATAADPDPDPDADPATAADDVTSQLMRVEVHGTRLSQAQVMSVLRNWTGGDLGSIALCVGVLVHHLALHPQLQARLRMGVPDDQLDLIIDEVLRLDDPFVSNRRVTTCPVELDGIQLPMGAKVKLHWTSANRDEAVFGDPDEFDPAGHADDNLVYGVGRHACPGRLLATSELRIAIRALLAGTTTVTLDPDISPEREVAPVGGWARVPILLD